MNYSPIRLLDTGGLTDEEFSRIRQLKGVFPVTIGGSDVAAILGVSPWKSPQELFDQKCGIEPTIKTERNVYQKEAGHALEDAVVRLSKVWFATNRSDLKVEIVNDTSMYQCGRTDENGELLYPFAVANLDRIIKINGKTGVFEAKTTSYRNKKAIDEWKSGIVPIYYETQIRHYMAVMNLDFAVISCLWGTGDKDIAVIIVPRDLEVESELLEAEKYFADCVVEGLPPDFNYCKPSLIADYYTRKAGVIEDAPPVDLQSWSREINDIIVMDEFINNLKEQLKMAEEERADIYVHMLPALKDSTTGEATLNGRKACVKVKQSFKREAIDEGRLLSERADVYEKYATALDTKRLKKEEPALYAAFLKPKELSDKPNSIEVKLY